MCISYLYYFVQEKKGEKKWTRRREYNRVIIRYNLSDTLLESPDRLKSTKTATDCDNIRDYIERTTPLKLSHRNHLQVHISIFYICKIKETLVLWPK